MLKIDSHFLLSFYDFFFKLFISQLTSIEKEENISYFSMPFKGFANL